MTYERFLKIGMTWQKQEKLMSSICKSGVDLVNFVDPYHVIIEELMKEVYGGDGYDWFTWFCYDAEYGNKDFSKSAVFKRDENGYMVKVKEEGQIRWGAEDEKGNPICYSWETLYQYLENNHKK